MKRAWVAVPLAVLVTAVVTYALSRYSLERPVLAENVRMGTLHSLVLGEDRPFLVHRPESYARAAARRYPVLYVLDGSSQDLHTAESAALMSRIGVMPELLVVGIPNLGGEGRQRDYTPPGMRQDVDEADSPEGRGDRFLAFLKEELIPRIESEYRADGRRMLAGYSRGGLLVVYSLIAEPELFEARFAHSPALWRDDDAIVGHLERFLTSNSRPGGFLYLSLGDEENEKMTRAFRRAAATLQALAPAALTWRADLTPGANHGSNARLATPVGFYACFARRQRC